jgi:hypothetical protein
MPNCTLLGLLKETFFPPLNSDQWTRPALAPCSILKCIGAYLTFVMFFGILLNGFVLHSSLNDKRSRSPIRVYMIALSLANLMGALLGIPLPLTSSFACR